MALYYLSDLHINEPGDAQYLRLLHFLKSIPDVSDSLIFGGDIFDLMVGDKKFFQEMYSDFFLALRDLCDEKKCTVYYLEGNHDFLLGNFFRSENFQLKANDFSLNVLGKKIWVSHGDLIDPEDTGYRFLRAFTRSIFSQALVKGLPGSFVYWLGKRSSSHSRKYNDSAGLSEQKIERLRSLYLDFSKRKIQEDYNLVLIGHSHIQDDVCLDGSERNGQYFNLGYTHSALAYGELSGKQEKIVRKVFTG